LNRQSEERLKVEERLRSELRTYFTLLERQIQTTITKATEQGIPTHNIEVLVDILFNDWHKDYTEKVNHYQQLIRRLGEKQYKELVEIQQRKALNKSKRTHHRTLLPIVTLNDDPVHTLAVKATITGDEEPIMPYSIEENPVVTRKLEQANFQFSEKTRARVNNDIHNILKLKETDGLHPREVGKLIQERFNKLKGYEAERIARTECNRACNTYRYEQLLNDDLIDYNMWLSQIDSRTRGQHKGDKANHIKLNGEIVRCGDTFSNGLRFPHDPMAPAYEVVNCRCTLVPYILPWDRMAPPGMSRFHESDLIPRPMDENQQFMLEALEDTHLLTPLDTKGLQINAGDIRVNGQQIKQALQSATSAVLGGYVDNLDDLTARMRKMFSPHTPKLVKPGRKLHLEDIVRESKPYTPTRTPTPTPSPSPVGEVSSVFTQSEQASYDDLMNKLMSTGGQVRLKKGKPTIVGGDLTNAERKLLQQLHNKKLSPLHNPKQMKVPTPAQREVLPVTGTHSKPVLSKKEVDKLSFKQLGEYYNAEYKGLVKYDYDGRQYHTFIEKVDGQEMFIRMEKDAIKTYTEGGVATPNEIIQEVLRVPKKHKYNTRGIWFKNNNYGIEHRATKTGFDSLPRNVKGYNSYYDVSKNRYHDGPDHEIVINPKHFKKSRGKIDSIYQQDGEKISDWQHTIRHEFAHSADTNMRRFREGRIRACYDEEYMQIHRAERDFTDYANTAIFESYAEHGGYVSAMLDHPEDHMKTITVEVMERGVKNIKHINFEEYKQMYPKHYEYFRKQCLEGL